MQHILISGTPGTGKTSFCDWLGKERGFIHIDMEVFQGSEHHKVWKHSLSRDAFADFISYLNTLGNRVVLSWGFPPECLPVIRKLQMEGIACFWFDAPEMMARDAFLLQATVSEGDFNRQMDKIRAHQKELLEFYGRRAICVMDGRRQFGDRHAILQYIEQEITRT